MKRTTPRISHPVLLLLLCWVRRTSKKLVLRSWMGIWGCRVGGRGRLNYKRSQLQSQPSWARGVGEWKDQVIGVMFMFPLSFMQPVKEFLEIPEKERSQDRSCSLFQPSLRSNTPSLLPHAINHTDQPWCSPQIIFIGGCPVFLAGTLTDTDVKNLFLFTDSLHSH